MPLSALQPDDQCVEKPQSNNGEVLSLFIICIIILKMSSKNTYVCIDIILICVHT